MKPVELVLLMRDKTRQALLDAGKNVDDLSADYEDLIRAIRDSEQAMESSGQSARRMASDYGSLQSVLAKIGGTAALLKFGKEMINVRSEFQNIEASFKVFLGDAEKANAFMKELQTYAFRNVFEFKDLAQQSAQLLAYGSDVQEVTSIIDKLSNVASGVNQPLERFVELYNKAKSRGKLDAIDIQQWSVAGDMIGYLADMLGKSREEIRSLVSEGKIGFKELDQVLTGLTEEGGKFSGMMEEKMKTLGDSVGLLKDSITIMFNELGEKSEDFLRGGILFTNTLVENYEKIGKALIVLIATYGTYRAALAVDAIINQIKATGGLINAIKATEIAQKALNATILKNPYVLAATAVIGLVTALIAFRKEAKTTQEIIDDLNKATDEYASNANKISNLADEYETLSKKASKSEEENKRLDDVMKLLATSVPTAAKEFDDYGKILSISTEKVREFSDAQKEALNISIKAQRDEAERRKEQIENEIEEQRKIYKEGIVTFSQFVQTGSPTLGGGGTWQTATRKATQDDINKAAKKTNELYAEQAKLVETITKANETLNGIVKSGNEQVNQNIEEQTKKNKAYWEQIKKNAEDSLSEMDISKKGTKEWEEQSKIITEAQKQLEKYNLTRKSGIEDDSRLQREAQSKADLLLKIANNESKAALDRLQTDYDLQQKLLDIEQDGFNKRLQQLSLNYRKELLAVEKQAQDLIEKQQESERRQWEISGKKGIFMPSTTEISQLSKEQQDELAVQANVANQVRIAGEQKLLDDLAKQYETYADRRLEIEKKFNEDLIVLQSRNIDGMYDEAIRELEKQRSESIKRINDEESAELIKTTDLFVRLFTEASELSVNQVKKVIDETRALYDYLATTSSEDITANFGFTAEQLRSFQANAEQMKSILDGLNAKKRELGNRSPVDAFAQSMKDAISLLKTGGKENISIGVEKIGNAAKEFLPYVKQFGDDLGAIFGQEIGSFVSGATEALGAVMNVAEGFAKGGIIGGIAAVVGEAAKLFTKAAEAEKRHQEALKEIADAKVAMQRQYNLLLLEQNLLLKEATTIFGEKQIEKAANALKVYREALSLFTDELRGNEPQRLPGILGRMTENLYKKQLEAYKEGIGALNQITIKTGHEKTGLFGWGKGRDVYSSILDVYGRDKLLNADGSLNIDFAKTILDTQTLTDENRNLLQSLIDLQEKANEAQEALRDYLQETFGALGGDLMDSIVASIRDKGVNAWETFGDAGSKVIENLGKQLAYELFFADKFAKLQKELEAVYAVTSDPEAIARKQMDIIGKFYETIGSDMDAAISFMENWQKEAEKYGFNLWQGATQQTGKAGAFTTISQDQAGKLEGLFTSVQNHTASIDDRVLDISRSMYESLDALMRIEENTSYCKRLNEIADDIAQIKRDGLKVK